MLLMIFITLFIFIPQQVFTNSLSIPLQLDSWGKIKNTKWNGSTPLSLSLSNGKYYELSIELTNKTKIKLSKSIAKNFENEDHYIFTLENPNILNEQEIFTLKVNNSKKPWPFNSRKAKLRHITSIPKLKQISGSKSVTHGGAGVVVVESEKLSNLSFLAVMDEKHIPFYPKRFIKDGFYATLFPWYTDNSQQWSNQYVLAIDTAGNTNRILIDTKPIKRTYRQSIIKLPKDYAKQKAEELALSQEKAEKLEGNIEEINKVLAKQPTFLRWKETRTSFQQNASEILTNNTLFSKPSIPMKKSITTATYGDQRKYYYQGKQVRQSVHRGLDYASFKNVPLYALLDGEVVYSDWYGGNGKTVIIDHGFNTYSLYAHNSELLVKKGQKVLSGEQISISGTTGQSTGDHLHLSIFVQGMFIEPKEWITENSINSLFHQPLFEAQKYIEQQTN